MRHDGSGATGGVASHASEATTVQKPILMAQAGVTSSAPQLLPLPAPEQITRIQPLPFGGGIEASAYALPDGVAFDRIRVVEIDGRLVLALVQPDGSVIVLEGTGPVPGSTTEFEIPNLLVGDVEVPRDALQAAFLDNGIVPAAGEPVSPSSGFNGDGPIPGIGDGLGVSPLLPPTELAVDAFEPRELGDDFGARNGLLGLAAGAGTVPDDSGRLPPSFVSGVIGTDGDDGDGDGDGGTGGPGTGGPGEGGNQGNGFMRLDQSAIAGGNQVNAGGVATLTNKVVILAGSSEARLIFGSVDSLETNSNGVAPDDLIWLRDPEEGDTRILGYVDRNGNKSPDDDELAVIITLEGSPALPEQTSSYKVTVTLLQGLPDPAPGPGESGSDTDGFDLGNIPLAIVDGRYTVFGEIDVVVLDDIPVQVAEATRPNIVDEDALPGGNIDSGAPGENNLPEPAATVSGSLGGLVKVGSDRIEPGSDAPLFFVKPLDDDGPHVLAGVTSKGETILLSQNGNVLTGYAEGNAVEGYQSGEGSQDRAVFTLVIAADGAYTFTLLDQVDHPALNGLPGDNAETDSPLVIDLSGHISARDSDFDTISLAQGSLTFEVLDDVPVARPPAGPSLMTFTSVFEDSGYVNVFEIEGSDGSSGSVDETPGDTTTVPFDAGDETEGRFTLNTGNNSALARVQVWADDGDGVFERNADLLVGEQLVSGLTWEELAAASANGTRDVFLAFDDDGANLDGDFDDLIVRAETDRVATAIVSARVEEDGMSGPLGQPGFPDGSTGNKDAADDNTQDEASGSAGSLHALFRVGADEDLTIGLAPTVPAGMPRLMSRGEEIEYVVSGNRITAFAGDREVFTLDVRADGSWDFDLKDQLDHSAGAGENTRLVTVGGGTVSGIDLSRLITGTDEDGDTVTAAAGAFVIQVEDDVPVAVPALPLNGALFTSVFQESGYFNVLEIQGADGETATVDETPGDSALVTFDATDGTSGNFVLNTGNDGPPTRVQVWVDDGDGLFDRNLDQLVDPPQPVSELTWEQIAQTSDNGRKDLFLAFDDAGANVDADFNDIIVRVESTPLIMVEEDGMSGPAGQPGFPDGSTGNKGFGDSNGQDEASGGAGSLNALFRSGSDEDLTIGLGSVTGGICLPRLLSRGEEVSYVVAGSTVTGLAGAREVFKLTVQPDGSWAFDLRDQLDHVPGNGENTILRTADGGSAAGIDFSGLITATDHDGDTVTGARGAFVVRVQDDVPVFSAASALVIPNEGASGEIGSFAFSVGADEPGQTRFSGPSGTTDLTVNGHQVLYTTSPDGQSVTGYVDLDGNSTICETERVFEARLLGGGTYGFQLFQAVDSGVALAIDGSIAFGSETTTSQILTKAGSNGDSAPLAFLTAWTQKSNFDAEQWHSDPDYAAAGLLKQSRVVGSSEGWGAGNNANFQGAEFFRLDFNQDNFEGSGFDGPAVAAITVHFDRAGGQPGVVEYVMYLEGGGRVSSTIPLDVDGVIAAPPGRSIDYIEFHANGTSSKFELLALTPAAPIDQTLALRIEHTDFDGDVATGSLSITLADNTIVSGSPCDDDSLAGSNRDDVINGLAGDDWLSGRNGDDILIGNLGSDTLTGGNGDDTFKLTDIAAQDLIADYGRGDDRIDLTALFSTGTDGPSSPTELLEYVRYENGSLSVDADGSADVHGFVQVAFVDTTGPGVSPPPSIQIVYDDQSHQAQTANLTG